LIWISRGRGGWAFWIPLGGLFLIAAADKQFHVLPRDPNIARWIVAALGLAFGSTLTGIGFYLNRGPGFWTIDSATGLQYFDKSARHSLYFIPMQYWGLFYCALALVAAVLYR
jgi:hypothetical protein